MSIYVASLDLGQAQDHSALTIIEAVGTHHRITLQEREPVTGQMVPRMWPAEVLPCVRMDVRHIERFPLGTKYKTIGELVHARLKACPQPCYFVIDETGVGIACEEIFASMRPQGITITGGNDATCPAPGKYRVPKRDLISPVQVRLQNGTLRIARQLPHAELLMQEILKFRLKISASGHDTYEAQRENDHDDLVLSVAMGAWIAEEAFKQRQRAVQETILQNQSDAMGPYFISPV